MKVDIVRPVKEDILAIEKVLYQSWLATYPNADFGITVEDIEYMFKDRFTDEVLNERWQKFASDPNVQLLVAKNENQIIGAIKIVVNSEKNQLKAIYLLPEYQGKGVGLQLWEEGKKFFDSTKDIIVHVATYNKSAIKFYEKLGFKDTGKKWTDDKFTMRNGAKIPEMEMEIKASLNIFIADLS